MDKFNRLPFLEEALNIVEEVYNVTKDFPKTEIFGLTSQFKRAAISIAANLGEGYRKKGAKEKLHFYNTSLCSLEECKIYCLISSRLQFANLDCLHERLTNLGKRIDKYCQAIQHNPINLK